jgi:hypothetical protein
MTGRLWTRSLDTHFWYFSPVSGGELRVIGELRTVKTKKYQMGKARRARAIRTSQPRKKEQAPTPSMMRRLD